MANDFKDTHIDFADTHWGFASTVGESSVTGAGVATSSGGRSSTHNATVQGSTALTAVVYKQAQTESTVSAIDSVTSGTTTDRAGGAETQTTAFVFTAYKYNIIGSSSVVVSNSVDSGAIKNAVEDASISNTGSVAATGEAEQNTAGTSTVTGASSLVATVAKNAQQDISITLIGSVDTSSKKNTVGTSSVDVSAVATATGLGVESPSGQAAITGTTSVFAVSQKQGIANLDVRGSPLVVSTAHKEILGAASISSLGRVNATIFNNSTAIRDLTIDITALQPQISFSVLKPTITITHIGD